MRRLLLSLVGVVSLGSAIAFGNNYLMTQGAGTTFGSILVGGVNYAQSMLCDLTTPGQCAAVSSAGAVKVDGSAVTQPVSGSVSVSNFPATQPVSGTVTVTGAVTANAGTNLNTSALALETGGNLAAINTTLGLVTASPVSNTIQDRLKSINTTLGTPFQAGGSIGNTAFIANAGTNLNTSALAIETGGNLASINTKTPALGQALSAASVPVVLPAAQITTLTPPTTVTVTQATAANLNITCANCSGSGASGTDEGGFTAGASVFAPGGGFFQTTATSNPLTTGQWGAWQMTANRAGFVNLRSAAGAELGISSSELFVGGRGTAGTATGGVLTVQGVASMTPFLTNPGTAALWGVNTLGSTTSGESGQLALGAVTTAAPTYTNAQSNALSLDTAGNLRTTATVTQATAANLNATVSPVSVSAWGLTASTQNSATPTNAQLAMGQFNTTPTTITSGNVSPFQLDSAGNLLVDVKVGTTLATVAAQTSNAATTAHTCSTAGFSELGCLGQIDDDIKGPIPAGTNNIGLVSPTPVSTSTCAPYHLSGGTAASNNSTNIKASAGSICDLIPINTTTTIYFLKIYDSATAPTCSSATGLKHVIPIPAGTGGSGFSRSLSFGETYSSGIGFCVTGGGSDTDNSSAATGVYIEASFK